MGATQSQISNATDYVYKSPSGERAASTTQKSPFAASQNKLQAP